MQHHRSRRLLHERLHDVRIDGRVPGELRMRFDLGRGAQMVSGPPSERAIRQVRAARSDPPGATGSIDHRIPVSDADAWVARAGQRRCNPIAIGVCTMPVR